MPGSHSRSDGRDVQNVECPRCGCNKVYECGSYSRFGQKTPRMRCEHCGYAWWTGGGAWASDTNSNPNPNPNLPLGEPKHEAVIYHLVRCKYCNSTNTKVTSTRRPIRHHKCRDCGKTFKSVEL